jgi:antitoxin (DNA-binding transcriptional repressor) of toxin-antitoxin stability system
MKTITTHEAKTHLSRYLAAAEQGDSFIIMRGKKAVARLTPLQTGALPGAGRPKVGEVVDHSVTIREDAFAPLSQEELKVWGI